MFIQNVAWIDVQEGEHMQCRERDILISICNFDQVPPIPKHKFAEIHYFEFLDLDEGDNHYQEMSIKASDAKFIVNTLKRALEEKRNVLVHCMVGMCRSGAVAEVGIMMGFQDTGTFRQPNAYVKKLLMRELGWTYEEQFERQPQCTLNLDV